MSQKHIFPNQVLLSPRFPRDVLHHEALSNASLAPLPLSAFPHLAWPGPLPVLLAFAVFTSAWASTHSTHLLCH